jgi:hypothetical protein
MGSYTVARSFEVHLPLRLKGWKVAIAIGAAVILAPVVGLVLLVLVGTLLPVLPLLATLFVRLWLFSKQSRSPVDVQTAPVVLRPPMSHPSIR